MGPLLLGLSVPRFVLHQMILPWLIYAAYEQAKVAGHRWAVHGASGWILLALTLVVIALGVLTRLVPLCPMRLGNLCVIMSVGRTL